MHITYTPTLAYILTPPCILPPSFCSLEYLLIWCWISWIDPLIQLSSGISFFVVLSGRCPQLYPTTFIFYFKCLRTFSFKSVFSSVALCFCFIDVIICHLFEDINYGGSNVLFCVYIICFFLFFPVCSYMFWLLYRKIYQQISTDLGCVLYT